MRSVGEGGWAPAFRIVRLRHASIHPVNNVEATRQDIVKPPTTTHHFRFVIIQCYEFDERVRNTKCSRISSESSNIQPEKHCVESPRAEIRMSLVIRGI